MEKKMTEQELKELLLEYGDRCYASGENKGSDAQMVANAERRKEIFNQIVSNLGAAVSASPQPDDHELGDPLWPIYQKYAEESPKPLLTYSGWLRTIAQKLEREFFAPAPAQEPPNESVVGKIVRVDHPRFNGYGFAQYDSGDRSRVIGVVLENGNTWDYEIETVRAATPEEIDKAPKAVRERLAPAQPVENSSRCKDFDWQCENCEFRDDPSIPGKPTICPKCGANRWKAVEPISSGASTGEQPEEFDMHITPRSVTRVARPSEPSAPKVEPENCSVCGRHKDYGHAPTCSTRPTQATEAASAPELPPVTVGKGTDREDVHPAWRAWRKGLPKSVLLRPGETENELTQAYDAIVKVKSAAAPSVAGTQPTREELQQQPHRAELEIEALNREIDSGAQGTPQVEEIARLAVDYFVEPERPRNDFYELFADHLRKHLPGAQPGPEGKNG